MSPAYLSGVVEAQAQHDLTVSTDQAPCAIAKTHLVKERVIIFLLKMCRIVNLARPNILAKSRVGFDFSVKLWLALLTHIHYLSSSPR